MVSICHNCSAIFEERHPEINSQSIWELILEDENFNYPNYHGEKITVQDQPQPPRNSKLAPKRFLYGAKGLFPEHSQEEKENLMREYCAKIKTAFHLAQLLFKT